MTSFTVYLQSMAGELFPVSFDPNIESLKETFHTRYPSFPLHRIVLFMDSFQAADGVVVPFFIRDETPVSFVLKEYEWCHDHLGDHPYFRYLFHVPHDALLHFRCRVGDASIWSSRDIPLELWYQLEKEKYTVALQNTTIDGIVYKHKWVSYDDLPSYLSQEHAMRIATIRPQHDDVLEFTLSPSAQSQVLSFLSTSHTLPNRMIPSDYKHDA